MKLKKMAHPEISGEFLPEFELPIC